ncbi:hypothetical protein GCM10011611_35130 [Aliidongia dinghuensis]|uniref:FecR protein domain-containing protein n=1 Tax=Aliidongia dinghuensis TaxID=1867774 RepID=A0A8J2YV88_9PROT|nr:hypothetical protein [Aliidongia dinghuensis]GGF26075.1 hypothetical protein GCM10011611_35130 [Aliidongia dinghuensis]
MGRQARRFVALFLAITYPIAVLAQSSGAVASLVRDVLSISRGQTAPHPLSTGEPVVEGQEIQTASTGAVNVNFPNGTALAALRQADITFGEQTAVAGQGLAQPLQGLDLVTLSPGVFRVTVGLQPTTVRTRRGAAFLINGQGGPATALIEEQADGSVTLSTLAGTVQVTSGGSTVAVPAGSSITLFGSLAALSAAAIQPMSAASQGVAAEFAAVIGPVAVASAAPAAGGSAGVGTAAGLSVSPLAIGAAAAAVAIGIGIAASESGGSGTPSPAGGTGTSTSTSTN